MSRRAKRLAKWAKTAEPRQLMAARIQQLMSRLNHRKISKKKRKTITTELLGYGIVPLRVLPKPSGIVAVRTDDGLLYDKFEVDGIIKVEGGDNVIGYYCPECMTAVNMGQEAELVVEDPYSEMMSCRFCGAWAIHEIREHNIVNRWA